MNCRKLSYEALWRSLPTEAMNGNCHKMSRSVARCRKMSCIVVPPSHKLFPNKFQTIFSGHVIPYLTGKKFSKCFFRSCNLLLQDYFLGSILKNNFELRLQSLTICDFEVAAIRVTKVVHCRKVSSHCLHPLFPFHQIEIRNFGLWKSIGTETNLGDKFGESLGGSQATPSFWDVPGLPRKFSKLPRKFFGDFPGSSLTVELHSNPGVPGSFPPRLSREFPGLPWKFPGLPRRSALSLWEA